MEKIYGIYNVVSNKSIRRHEKKHEVQRPRHKFMLGRLVKTNRGWFIDGHQVDMKAVATWQFYNKNEEAAKPVFEAWKAELKRLKELEANEQNKETQES